jgi:hypothetical protein
MGVPMTKPTQPPLLGKNGFKYKEQYGLIIVCKDAQHQEQLFNQLRNQDYKVKVVTV